MSSAPALSQPVATVVAALVAALIGGIGVAVVSWLLNRRRTQLEMEKLRAEIANLTDRVTYSLPSADERLLFDGRKTVDGFDIRGHPDTQWQDNRPSSPRAAGDLTIEGGNVINIRRDNIEGRFQLFAQQYVYEGRPVDVIPSSSLIGGKRKLRVACDAKTVGGHHTLRFIVRNPAGGNRLAEEAREISSSDWQPVELFFRVDPGQPCQLRIDDEVVSNAPSSVQIRNLVIAERRGF